MAALPTTLMLEVATPLGMALSLETDSVQVPSVSGEMGVAPGHVALLAAVKPGILTYKKDAQLMRAAVGAGFLEVTGARARLITEYFLTRDQIDVAAAQSDLQAAETKLKATKATIDELEYQELERESQWAQARLQLAGGESN